MSAWLEDSDIVYERRRTPSRSEPSFESDFDNDDDGIGGDGNDADGGILYMRSRSNGAPAVGSSAGRTTAMYPYQYQCRYPYQYPYPLSYPRPAFEQTRSGSIQEQSKGGYEGGVEKNQRSREASRVSGVGKEREGEKEAEAEFESQKDLRGEPLRRHAHSFFSEELGTCRAAYLKLVVRATVLIFLLVWAVLPIYWGSMSAAVEKTGNLEVWVINRDHARIGDSLEVAVLAAPSSGPGALWWRVVSEDNFPDEQSVIQGIVEERAWLAVVVNTNATNNLTAARFAGDTNYDPSSAISVYYAQARNEVVTGTYLLPIITQFLTNFTTNYSTGSTQRYLAAIVANNGTVNVTALNSVAQAPQTITPGVAFEVTNVRPYTTPVAQAPLLVGQIYICIFAFMIAMAHSTARSFISDYLTLPSYLILRIVTPLLTYLPLSLSYALISVAFKLPFNGGRFSYGAGFMAFFGFVYLGMAALGLALEAMGTLLGPRFVPLFLVLLIIVNVSTAVLPPELLPGLYSYGAGFQFWNIQQATRTILFGTYSHLGKNAGILIAWVLISCCTTALFTWFMRYWEVRKIYRSGRKGKTREGKSKDKGKHVVDEEYGPPEEVKGKAKAPSRDYAYDYQKDDKNGKNEKSERNKKAKSTISAFERWERMKNSYRNTKAASAKATSNPNFRSPSALASASHVAATRGEENPSQGSGRGEPTSHGDPDDKNRRPDDEREPDIREEEYKDEGYINKNIEENGPLDVRVRVEEVALSRTP